MNYDGDFVTWWFTYPRRTRKKDAYKRWLSAVSEIAEEKGISVDGAKQWLLQQTELFAKSDTGQSGRYCPHPSTWLNQGRYDDDPGAWSDSYRVDLDSWKSEPWTGQGG